MGALTAYRQRRADLVVSEGVTPLAYRRGAGPAQLSTEDVILPAFCSLHGQPTLIVAARRGNTLTLLRGEQVPPGFSGGAVPPLTELGELRIEGTNWTGCAYCGTKNDLAYGLRSVWSCRCERCEGHLLLQCAGNRGGWFRCACGRFTEMNFVSDPPTVAVQAWRSNAAMRPAAFQPEPSLSFGFPPVPQITAPPSSTLRLGFRGKP